MKMGLTVTEANMMYIKQEMRIVIGDKPQALLNCLSVVLYREDTPLEELSKSLDVIQADLKLRIEQAKRDKANNDEGVIITSDA